MGDPNVKIFTVTGESASAIGGTRKRKRRATARAEMRKVEHDGSPQKGGTSPGTLVQVQANRAPNAPLMSTNFQKSTEVVLAKPAIATESAPAPVSAPVSVSTQGGGIHAKPVKVILEKKKKGTRVILGPTKVKKLNPIVSSGSQAKTRKVAKKIRMSLNGFGKRVTRANTIRVEAKKQSIEDLKKTLVEAKLIKAESKAPEGVLRQMYADYMTLKNRAL